MKNILIILLITMMLLSLPYSAEADTEDYYFEELFSKHGSVMIVIDVESGVIVDANQAAVDFYGYSREQLLTMNIKEINTLPPEKVEQEYNAAAEEKRNYFLFSHRLSDGSLKSVEVYSYPFRNNGKELLFSIVHDITSKKQLEEQLRIRNRIILLVISMFLLFMLAVILVLIRSLRNQKEIQYVLKKEKEKYQSLFENMREGLVYNEVLYDDTGKLVNLRLLDINSAYERIIGLRRDEIVNRTATEVFPQLENYWMENCREVILTGRSMQFENHFQATGMYLSVNIFEPEKGKIAFVFSDVTEDRIQKEKLISANKELIAVNTLRDKLFTVITNDVREPLAILVNLSELLIEEMKNDSNEKCEIVLEIQKHVRDAFFMVDNLLEWFRTKKGLEVFISMKCELSELVQAAIQMTAATAEEKNIRVISHIPEGTTVHVDKDMIELVITNLLSNAIKYSYKNGRVIITTEEDKEMIIVSVKDSGVGITPEKVQLLFQDVIDNTSIGTEGERGIGVGLFICRRLIQINGGDIWVESTPGEGSNFFISIPRSK